MKKVFVAILTTALMSSLGFAKPSLVVGEKAKSFLKERHYTGVKYQGGKVVQKPSSLVVSVDESSKKTISDIKNLLGSSYKVSSYSAKKNVVNFKKDGMRVDISDLEKDRSACAQRILNEFLPSKYANQFKLVSVDREMGYSETDGARVNGYTFNFKRLYNGRVVRNIDNFLTIETDGNGRLIDGDVALQDLKTTTEYLTTDDAAEENEATLDSLLNTESGEVEILADDGLPKKERVKNVEVGSVAEAYCEVEDGSAKKLFPCLSYASTVNLEDGGKVSRIIDVPHSRGSWHHNRKGKKPVKFHRFNH